MAFVLRPPGERDSAAVADRLTGIAGARRTAILFRRFAGTIATVLAIALIVAWCDAVWSLPSIVRATGLVGMLSAGIAGIISFVSFSRQKRSNLDLALAIESHRPEFQDALGSAVAFATEANGNERFRDVTQRRAANQLRDVELDQFVPTGKAIGASISAAGLIGLATTLMLVSPLARHAAKRFFDPFGHHPWPSKTSIELRSPLDSPHRMARGDSFDIRFCVTGVVPELGSVQLRLAGQPSLTEPVPLKPDGETVVSFDASRIPTAFEFRLIANDADTGWRSVEVLPPPRLVPREGRPSPQVTIDPPLYSGLPRAVLPDGTGVIESVNGTHVTIAAQSDRRIVSAEIAPHGDLSHLTIPATLASIGSHPLLIPACEPFVQQFRDPVKVTVSGEEGTRLDLAFIPRWSGLHALTFTDETGLAGTRLFDIRFYPDPAPAVALDRPNPQQDALMLLPSASVRVETRADDRTFGLRTAWLEYRIGNRPEWTPIPYADMPALSEAMPGILGGPLGHAEPKSVSAAMAATLPLSRLTLPGGGALSEGETLTLRSAADDFDTVSVMKEPGRSREVVIRIVSRATLESTMQKALVELRAPLKQTLEQVNDAKRLADQAQMKLDAGQPLSPQDRDALDRAAQAFAQAKGRLNSPQDGLRDRLNDLQRLVTANDLPRTGTAAQVESVARTMNRTAGDPLDAAEAALSAARREANPALATPALEEFRNRQQATAAGLKSIVDRLERWGAASELRAEAQTIKDKLGDANPKDPKSADELTKRAGEAMNLMDRAGTMAAEKSKSGDEGSKTEADAIRTAMEKAGGSQAADELRQAAAAANAGRGAEAERLKQSAANRLGAMSDALAEREKETTVDELKKKRKQDATDLDALREQQDELRKKSKQVAESAAGDPMKRQQELERLAREQDKLAKDADKLAERLTRDRADRTADQVRQAADQMRAAAERQQKGQTADAEQKAAEQQLERANQELKRESREADQTLEREKREQWLEQVKAFRGKQKAALDEANRLLEEAIKEKAWERAKLVSLDDLADLQKRLGEEVGEFRAKHLEEYPVFGTVAEKAKAAMDRAAKRLAERKDDLLTTAAAFDPETERLAHSRPVSQMAMALKSLDMLLDALKDDPKKDPARPMGGRQGGGGEGEPMGGGGGEGQKGIPPIAQLKVLRALQADLNERTTLFDKVHPDPSKDDDDAKVERAGLEKDQKEIASLFEKLLPLLNPMGELP
jgi:hypothetical protein